MTRKEIDAEIAKLLMTYEHMIYEFRNRPNDDLVYGLKQGDKIARFLNEVIQEYGYSWIRRGLRLTFPTPELALAELNNPTMKWEFQDG